MLPSTSTCNTDTIVYEGVSYDITVPTPDNNGSVEVEVDYDDTAGAISSYAIALCPTGSSLIGQISSDPENLAAIFANYPTGADPVTLPGGAGFWSPLFTIGVVADPNTYTFTGLPPGQYIVLVVPNVLSGVNGLYLECEGQPFLKFEDYLTTVNVGFTAPEGDCEQECLSPPCTEYTYGCTDPNATNYDDTAAYDDGLVYSKRHSTSKTLTTCCARLYVRAGAWSS